MGKTLAANNTDWLFARVLKAPGTHVLEYLKEGKHTTTDKTDNEGNFRAGGKSFVIHFFRYFLDDIEQGDVKVAESNLRHKVNIELVKGKRFIAQPTAMDKIFLSVPQPEAEEEIVQ